MALFASDQMTMIPCSVISSLKSPSPTNKSGRKSTKHPRKIRTANPELDNPIPLDLSLRNKTTSITDSSTPKNSPSSIRRTSIKRENTTEIAKEENAAAATVAVEQSFDSEDSAQMRLARKLLDPNPSFDTERMILMQSLGFENSTVPDSPKLASRNKHRSLQLKVQALDEIRAGVASSAVCLKYDIPESTLRGWKKTEHRLRAAYRDQKPNIPTMPISPDRMKATRKIGIIDAGMTKKNLTELEQSLFRKMRSNGSINPFDLMSTYCHDDTLYDGIKPSPKRMKMFEHDGFDDNKENNNNNHDNDQTDR